MPELTESQIARLREWAADKAGYKHGWLYYDNSALYDESGNKVMLFSDWHPETSLDQAVMVAEKLLEDDSRGWWRVGRNIHQLQYGSVAMLGGVKTLGSATSETPATALLLACAKACGEEVGE